MGTMMATRDRAPVFQEGGFGSSELNVAVIGAGITGVTTAYNLARRGCRVTLFDKHPYAAMEASFANGGQLSASNAEVWNHWGTVLKGLRWMLKPGAPLLVRPAPSWHKLSWLAEFVGAIPHYEENTVATVRLAIEARRQLLRVAEEAGIEFDREERGILHFYETKPEFEQAGRVSALLARGGLERRAVTPEEMHAIEPALHGKLYGGWFTPSDFTGDIHKFTNGLAAACKRLGVDMRLSTVVLDARADDDAVTVCHRGTEPCLNGGMSEVEESRFDKLVVCSGVASRALGRWLGDRVNVYPVKGYSITVNLPEPADQAAAPWVSLLDDKAKIVASRLGLTRLRVAGTAEFGGANNDITADRIEPLVAWCRAHFPGMSTRQAVPWAGLRPMMPNMMPRVMQGRHPRIFYNTGHGHLGWTLCAATADAVAALATRR